MSSSRGTGKEEPPGALYPQGQRKAETGEEVGVAERPRLPRIPLADPQCRKDERDQFLWVCPVYASSFAQLNQEKIIVAEIQASGGLEEDL